MWGLKASMDIINSFPQNPQYIYLVAIVSTSVRGASRTNQRGVRKVERRSHWHSFASKLRRRHDATRNGTGANLSHLPFSLKILSLSVSDCLHFIRLINWFTIIGVTSKIFELLAKHKNSFFPRCQPLLYFVFILNFKHMSLVF